MGKNLKKITEEQRVLFSIRARRELKAVRRSNANILKNQIDVKFIDTKNRYEKIEKSLPEPVVVKNSDAKIIVIRPPSLFSLYDNYEETMSFLMLLRKRDGGSRGGRQRAPRSPLKRWRDYIDISNIEEIDPATGLVLAAELDWLTARGAKFKSHEQTWHENVRSLFEESGLFDLLNLAPKDVHSKEAAGPERRMVKYITGEGPDGERADKLRREMEALCGETFGPRVAVNNSLCEAMTNAHHHAYPRSSGWFPARPEGKWWASCAWTPSSETLHMMIYDQGVGIPATLPKSHHWSDALPFLNRFDPERTDAGLIQAALELRRTSTNIQGRGRGLYEMAEWIDRTGSGFLRIVSGSGKVTYGAGKIKREKLSVPFIGTLVEWEIDRGQ